MLTEKIIDFIGIMACVIMIVCICFFFKAIDNKQSSCTYCHGTIVEDADYVCMKGGRRMHAECYLKFKEDTDGTD